MEKTREARQDRKQKEGKRERGGPRYTCPTDKAALNTYGRTQNGNGSVLPRLEKVNTPGLEAPNKTVFVCGRIFNSETRRSGFLCA
jgi:hypothetical protein